MGCPASESPLEWRHQKGIPEASTKEFLEAISKSEGGNIHLCVNSWEGLTTNMIGFLRRFENWK
jgi:hypothetical protein